MSKLLAVIHVESESQAVRNAQLARNCGANGIFVINHSVDHEYLCMTYETIRAAMPTYWIGMNSLGNEDYSIFPDGLDGIWMDHLGVEEESQIQPYAERNWNQFILSQRDRLTGKPLLFGGVAFKYQRPVYDVLNAARIGAKYCDVVTTSGEGTGFAPNLKKIQEMKEGAGSKQLAVASGMTPDNVEPFIPFVDYFLVATGISSSFTELDENKVKQFVEKINVSEEEVPGQDS